MATTSELLDEFSYKIYEPPLSDFALLSAKRKRLTMLTWRRRRMASSDTAYTLVTVRVTAIENSQQRKNRMRVGKGDKKTHAAVWPKK